LNARLLDGMRWTDSSATDIRQTLRAHGFKPPEQHAQEVEQNERLEGALRCMRRIQAEGVKR